MTLRFLLVALAACGGGGGFPIDADDDVDPPTGRFSLAWSVTDANGQPIACSQVGAQVVSLAMRNLEVAGGFSEAFTCNSLMGESAPLPPGTYEITFALTGLSGQLATAPIQQNIEIKANETTPLMPITFAVDATGGLELSLSANQTGGNCAAMASMGAGIENLTITLRHTDNTCEPVVFQISGGGTYTVDCANPQLAACIESDQTLTVQPVPSGNYRVQIRGKVGGVDCWTNDDSLVVPPMSKVLKTTLNLVKAPGC